MVFTKEFMQQFRDSDEDGLIGVRGYINFFQDAATEYMHNIHRGNDTLPEEFGISWVYTKYKICLHDRLDFDGPSTIETWVSYLDRVRTWQDICLTHNGKVFLTGRLESCLAHMDEGRLAAIKEINLPEDLCEERDIPMPSFTKTPRKPPELLPIYEYTVRYTDLDKSHHMNNLHYIELFLNAFGPEDYSAHPVKEFEIHYLTQSFYGETLQVCRNPKADGIELYAMKEDGSVAAVCRMETD